MDEKKTNELNELLSVLEQVPDKYHAAVSRALAHDANIMARTLRMVDEPTRSAS